MLRPRGGALVLESHVCSFPDPVLSSPSFPSEHYCCLVWWSAVNVPGKAWLTLPTLMVSGHSCTDPQCNGQYTPQQSYVVRRNRTLMLTCCRACGFHNLKVLLSWCKGMAPISDTNWELNLVTSPGLHARVPYWDTVTTILRIS